MPLSSPRAELRRTVASGLKARPWQPLAACATAVLLAGCANLAGGTTGAGATAAGPAASAPAGAASAPATAAAKPASAAASGAASAPAPTPPQPPFATVIKDARKIDGAFTLWQKDEKVWIELAEKDFGQPLFLSPKLATGIGEARLFGGSMREPQLVEFRRIHNQVQLIERNTAFVAEGNAPVQRAIRAALSPSLVASAGVASQPHPERKSVLVELSAMFLADVGAVGPALQRTYRQGYSFDARNSAFTRIRNTPDETVFEVQSHFATATIAVPQPGSPPGSPVPTVPSSVPDPRSLFVTMLYSLSRLPEQPMKPRAADARVGYFMSNVDDYSDDLARNPRRHFVNRWRLEKKDPAAALSEPVKPITFWLDRTIPEKYRAVITAGILEWNKAFERIGFKEAIAVKQQPDDADFDTLDLSHASVRWMTNASPQFGAIGPSHVDPRSGEILDADIGIESLSSRSIRTARAQVLAASRIDWAGLMQSSDAADASAADGRDLRMLPGQHRHSAECNHADIAAEQLSYGLDVLDARGDLDPDSPEAEAFVQSYLKDVTMHEVGHTLGLRHNFRSSRIRSDKQLSDPQFTRDNSLAGSVMEYSPINLPRPGEPMPAPFENTLGPYDYWAIEYAYKPIAPADEAAELQRIAGRSAEPDLAYGTDEDAGLGLDPEVLMFDLGDDPLVFARKRFEIARDLIRRQESRELKPTQDFAVLRRSIGYALRDVGRAAGIAARQIGGLRTLRDFPNTGRDPLAPTAAGTQREALDLLSRYLLSADGLAVSPALQRKLAPDYLERTDAVFSGSSAVATDFSPQQFIADMQRALLAQLMSEGVAARLLDAEGKVASAAERFSLNDLYERLAADIWSELGGSGDISAARRELQREHLNRVTAALLRPGSISRADLRSQLRVQARALLARIETAQRRAGLGAEARAHLADSAESLREALNAKLTRSGA